MMVLCICTIHTVYTITYVCTLYNGWTYLLLKRLTTEQLMLCESDIDFKPVKAGF